MENVLLTFLSPVKFLNGEISATPYKNVSGEPTKTTNESAVRYLLQDDSVGNISKIFIFASKAVRADIKDYRDDNGNTMTHLEYFKNRMKNFMPNVDECITEKTIYHYDENGDGEKNLRSVAEMAERIQNYARGKEICLHADLTGGMRHINMMMLDVIRLLEYSGVKIEKLLYSNLTTRRVEELNDIYDLFQLISGVEEFVNFGSVEALNKYYDANADKFKKSDALKKLTDAMNNFAKSIKLCRYGDFKKAIEKLHDAINDFKSDPQNLHDIFMARLIEKIREKYDLLISTRGEDDIKIIRWCLKHGYLQQALTLYTERIPEYLGNQHFIDQSPVEAQKLENALKGDNRRRWFYLLAEYLNSSEDVKNINKEISKKNNVFNNTYRSLIRNATTSIKQGNFTYEGWRQNLIFLVKPPRSFTIEDILPDENILRVQLELLDKIYKEPQILIDLSSDELQPISGIIYTLKYTLESEKYDTKRRKTLFNYLGQMTAKDIKENFPQLKLDVRISRLQYFLDNVIFSLNISEEKFFDIMKKYFRLKDERNNINHANEKGNFDTADALENFMLDGLDEIEAVEKNLSR